MKRKGEGVDDMKNTEKIYIAFSIVVLLLVMSIAASSLPFRFYPTHKIVKQVFCISCHAEELEALKEGRHIRLMDKEQSKTFYDYVNLYGNMSEPAKTLMGSCYTCHVTYESFNLFGLTDPYVYPSGSRTIYTVGNTAMLQTVYSAQYGSIISWPWPFGNRTAEYSNASNVTIATTLQVLSVEPANATVTSTVKIVFRNYSGQQTGNITSDSTQDLHMGDNQTVTISNMVNDYFSVMVLLDGTWSSTVVSLTVNGTDKGTESFVISADSPSILYDIPKSLTGVSYFKTNGTYRSVRLDDIWYVWRNMSVNGNITSSDTVWTNSSRSPTGWISTNTCSSQGGMCHIIQKATSIGLSDDTNPNRMLYPHKMESVTSKQCKVCHLEGG